MPIKKAILMLWLALSMYTFQLNRPIPFPRPKSFSGTRFTGVFSNIWASIFTAIWWAIGRYWEVHNTRYSLINLTVISLINHHLNQIVHALELIYGHKKLNALPYRKQFCENMQKKQKMKNTLQYSFGISCIVHRGIDLQNATNAYVMMCKLYDLMWPFLEISMPSTNKTALKS